MQQTVKPHASSLEIMQTFDRSSGRPLDPAWLRDMRKHAMADFERLGFPTARRGNEPWKYTNVRSIEEASFTLAEASPSAAIDLAPYELPCPRVHQLVFVDGQYEPRLSTEPATEAALHNEVIAHRGDGPVVGRLADAVEYRVPLAQEHLGQLAPTDNSGFTALNAAFLHDGAFVHIPSGVSVPEPIYLLFISTAEHAAMTHPRVLIVAGAESSATILTSFEGIGGGAYFTNAVTEATLGAGANLRLYTLQRESGNAFHVATTQVRQAQDSRLSSVTVDLGGGLVRRDLNVALAESGAHVGLFGLYHGVGKRHVDNHTLIDHAVPETSSNEVYKGILDGESRGVFVGSVLVRHDAQHTEAHQVNKNLLLSPDAEVDTQPKLEIFSDDVICTHGAAVGQLDTDALFYLKSRGIAEDQARALLVGGFVSEIVTAIEDGAMRQFVDAAVRSQLGGSE